MFQIIQRKNPIFFTDNYDVVLVGTSIFGDLEVGGFQAQMRFKYPYIHEINYSQNYGDTRLLGTRVTIEKEGNPTISLLYICGYLNKKTREELDIDALENCLATANAEFKGKRIITIPMGASKIDGGHSKSGCLRYMRKHLTDVDVDVYDYPQEKYKDMCWKIRRNVKSESQLLKFMELKKNYLK